MSAWYLSTSSPSWKRMMVGTTTTLYFAASDGSVPISNFFNSQSDNLLTHSMSFALFHPALKYFTSTWLYKDKETIMKIAALLGKEKKKRWNSLKN